MRDRLGQASLLSLLLIVLAVPAQAQKPGQKARGWYSIGQNAPRLFEGILTEDLDLETEDGLVISKEDLGDRIYFDAEEQQFDTGRAILGSAAAGFLTVLSVDLLIRGVAYLQRELSDEHNKDNWEGISGPGTGIYVGVTVGMGVLGGILSGSYLGVWKDW
ncbi:MAG: hypothetical protein OXU33_00825 [Gemmatimonadota bacterium]|nr:hypothetical protein [Gemmatimonadota bacterium]MDE3004735.1 hypothetical protein [Gemmatimonadota bacterium]MDE3012603.1 hypothetical protein [Gemmatimonadota bacterium]